VGASHSGVSLKKAKTTFGVAELGYEIIGATTGGLPLQINHTFIQQRPTFYLPVNFLKAKVTL
jgi:hypothetical protein